MGGNVRPGWARTREAVGREPPPRSGGLRFGQQVGRGAGQSVVAQVPAAGVYSTDYQEMNGLLTPEIQRYAAGEQDAQTALKNAADAIRDRTQRS